MRLSLSIEALSPALTGIGRYTWELARGLLSEPHIKELRYYRTGRWGQELDEWMNSAMRPALPVRMSRWLGKRLVPPRIRHERLRRASQDWLFHGPNYFLPPWLEAGIVTVHDLSIFKYPETHPQARRQHFDREFHRSLQRALHVITDSQATRQEVMEFLGWPAERITAVPLGVSSAFHKRGPEELNPSLAPLALLAGGYVLCVSTLEPRKRVGALLDAFRALPSDLRARHPLVLAGGKGWLSAGLECQIEQGQQEGWLRYLGFVNEKNLHALYAGAKLFVYPSVYEGFGLPVLEAMASGVPVITSNRSSLPEVASGVGLLVDPDDPDALRLALRQGLEDEAWRAKAASMGPEIAGEFTWERCVKATTLVYLNVASQTAAACPSC